MDKYQPVRVLGEGSFGKVYLMQDKVQRKLLCVKVIKIKNIPKKERDATKLEVDLLRRLHHPNIVRYIDSFLSKNQDSLCIAMEYCDGGDLAAQVKAARKMLFSENKILHWFVQIALGVHYMHSNQVLHRDLKTQNIFLTGNGRLVLGDLGISKVLEGTMDFAKTCIGTPYYMSPEIFKNKPYSYKSDVWALGCVLYEMTTLTHAFDATSINGLAQKIIKGKYPPISAKYSKPLRDLITEMLMTEPRQRPDLDQILKKPFIRKHIVNFFADIASRPSSSIGEGTMIVRVAAGGPSGISSAADTDQNMMAFRKQLQSLDMLDEVQQALGPRPTPSNPVEAKKIVKEQAGALAREQDHKKMVEAALEKLRQERELRLKERNAMAANARGRAMAACGGAVAPFPVKPAEEADRKKREDAMKPAAMRQPQPRRESDPAREGGIRRRSFGEERDKISERDRIVEARRLAADQEDRDRAEAKRKEDFKIMMDRAEAKKAQDAEARAREAKEEAVLNQKRELQRAQEDALARREQQREKERERQRLEIEQLKKDKLELDRRSQEREKIRETRRQEERKKLEDALKEKEYISPYQREQLAALEEKLGAPQAVRSYSDGSSERDSGVSSRDMVLQRKQEKLARDEASRIEQLKAAEMENRRLRAIANAEGRSQYRGSVEIGARPTGDAMSVNEMSDALQDVVKGPSRYDSGAAAPKKSGNNAEPAKAVSGGFDSDTDSDDAGSSMWEPDSEVGSVSSDALEEDLRRREDELKQELQIATMRCTQLKATLKETKSFFRGPGDVPVPGKDISRPTAAAMDSSEDEDYGDLDEGSDYEESWTEQSADVAAVPGRKLFVDVDAKYAGDSKDDLESTAPRLQKAKAQVAPNPYYNLHDAPSPSGRLSDRIERLRQRCTQALGRGAFEDAYNFLKQSENDERGCYEEEAEKEKQRQVRAILGEGKAHYMPLIEQLIFMEETHSS